MKLILTGHEGSKRILETSSYLLNKYVPKSFDIKFLNYGSYDGKLFTGEFVSLDSEQVGGKGAWSKYVHDYVDGLKDKYVILGVDDHLINSPVDMKVYRKLVKELKDNVVSARLCDVKWYKDYISLDEEIIKLRKHADYSVTGQYTIWDRKVLLTILKETKDIWDFENGGSACFNSNDWAVVASLNEPFKYDTVSALSGNSPVNYAGVEKEDLNYITNNLLCDS